MSFTGVAVVDHMSLTPQFQIQRFQEVDEYCECRKGIAIAAYVVAYFSAGEQQKWEMIQRAEQNFRAYTYVQDINRSVDPVIENYGEVFAKAAAAMEETLQQGVGDEKLVLQIMRKLNNTDLKGLKKLNRKPYETQGKK